MIAHRNGRPATVALTLASPLARGMPRPYQWVHG